MLVIDPACRTAPYEQLRGQLADAVHSGELVPGAKLPTVRRLAADLGIAPGTVARAYLELEREHLIETRGRRGSFVAQTLGPAPEQSPAQQAADRYVESVRRLDVDDATAVRLVRLALQGPATSAP